MNLHVIDISIIAIYLILCLIIGFIRFGKIRNIRDYTMGTRPFSTTVLIVTTFATAVSSAQVVGNIGKVYELGFIFIIPLMFFPLTWFVVAKVFAPNLLRFHSLKFMSLSDIMESFYGKLGRYISNIVSIVLSIAITATGALATGYLLHYFCNIPEIYGIIIGVIIVTIYSAFGGITSVAFTDVFQFVVFFIALPITCIIGYNQIGGFSNLARDLPAFEISNDKLFLFFSLILYSMAPYTSIPYIQRALIAKNQIQFRQSFIIVGVLFIPLLVVISLIGLITYKLNPNINPNSVFYYFIDHHLGIGVKGFMIAGVLAIIMSTQDSYLNTTSSLIAYDICKKIWPDLTEKQELLIARISCVAISGLSVFVVFVHKGIIDIIWFVDNFWLSLVEAPLLAGLLGARVSKKSFKVLIIGSLSATVIVRLFTGVFDTRSLVAGVLVSVLVLYFGNQRYKKQHPELTQKKTASASLSIRLRNSLLQPEFSSQSLYIVSIILGAGFIIGTGFLGFQQLNFLNILFLCISITFLLLLLADIWGDDAHKNISFFWQMLFTVSILLLPAYMMIINGFKVIWIVNLTLSLILFTSFTNKTKAILLGASSVIIAYIISRQNFANISNLLTQMHVLSFGYMIFIIIALVLTIYQAKYVSKEIIRQLEVKVSERTSELKKALYVKQEFLNKLSHEVRTPIHNMTGIASGLSDGWDKYSETERKRYVDIISDSADRLMDYISGILDLASIKQNKFILQVEDNVNIANIAKQMIDNIQSMILLKHKKLFIKLQIPQELPLTSCDPTKISQIIHNLLVNAIKYSNQGTIYLIVNLDESSSSIVISVIDEGVGIPDEEKKKIFEAFFEGSRTKTNAEGKGLGLAIVKEFVELHNGSVNVVDNKPAGSIFIITIPVK